MICACVDNFAAQRTRQENSEQFFKIIQSCEKVDPLMKAIHHSYTEEDYKDLVQELHKFINQNDIDFNSTKQFHPHIREIDPLQCCILLGDLELIKLLISKGCDVNKDLGGISPISFAASITIVPFNNTKIIKLLLENKADPNEFVLLNNFNFKFKYNIYLSESEKNILELLIDYGYEFEEPWIPSKSDRKLTFEQVVNNSGHEHAQSVIKLFENEKEKRRIWRESCFNIIKGLNFNLSICRMIVNLSNRH